METNKKIKIVIIALSLIINFALANAVPAPDINFTITQHNTTIFAKLVGDENKHKLVTEDGYTITQTKKGKYIYVTDPGNNLPVFGINSFKESDYEVGKADPQAINAVKNVTFGKQSPSVFKVAQQAPTTIQSSSTPSTGNLKIIAIRVNFQDQSIDSNHDYQYFDQKYNGNSNSLKSYFSAVSYGNLNIDTTISQEVYTLPHSKSHYSNPESYTIVPDAVNIADNDIDFSNYHSVIVIHAGLGEESSGNANDYWSMWWDLKFAGLYADGTQIKSGIVVPEDQSGGYDTLGVLCHEFGHELGLPDLYDTIDGSVIAGYWGLMGTGVWGNGGNDPVKLSAWSRQYLGWTNTITNPDSANIDASSNKVYKITSSALNSNNEYFLVENRQKTGQDVAIYESGIIIWHIDDDIISSKLAANQINTGSTKGIVPEYVGSLSSAAFSKNDNQKFFNSSTSPNSDTNNGQPTDVTVIIDSYESQSMQTIFSPEGSEPDLISYTINIQQNWNMISMPASSEDISTAEDFCSESPDSEIIAFFNSAEQNFVSHPCGVPTNNFDITADNGYMVYNGVGSSFSFAGSTLSEIEREMKTGWNLIPWLDDPMNAETLCQNIPGCQYVTYYNTSEQQYVTHIKGVPVDNFQLSQENSYFVYVDFPSTIELGL